jgi:hypothetical protein
MNRSVILVAGILLSSCASTGEFRSVSHDQWLESEASRNDSLAYLVEGARGGAQSAEAFRAKARELRAERKSTPSAEQVAVEFGIDVLFQVLLGALDGSSRSKPSR